MIIFVNSYYLPFFDLLLVFSIDRDFVDSLNRALSRRSFSSNRESKSNTKIDIDLANFDREIRVELLSSFRLRVAKNKRSIFSIFL